MDVGTSEFQGLSSWTLPNCKRLVADTVFGDGRRSRCRSLLRCPPGRPFGNEAAMAASRVPVSEGTLADGAAPVITGISLSVLFFLRNRGFIHLQFVTMGCPKRMKENSRDCQGPVGFETFGLYSAQQTVLGTKNSVYRREGSRERGINSGDRGLPHRR